MKWAGRERNEGVTPEELTMTTSSDLRLASRARRWPAVTLEDGRNGKNAEKKKKEKGEAAGRERESRGNIRTRSFRGE